MPASTVIKNGFALLAALLAGAALAYSPIGGATNDMAGRSPILHPDLDAPPGPPVRTNTDSDARTLVRTHPTSARGGTGAEPPSAPTTPGQAPPPAPDGGTTHPDPTHPASASGGGGGEPTPIGHHGGGDHEGPVLTPGLGHALGVDHIPGLENALNHGPLADLSHLLGLDDTPNQHPPHHHGQPDRLLTVG